MWVFYVESNAKDCIYLYIRQFRTPDPIDLKQKVFTLFKKDVMIDDYLLIVNNLYLIPLFHYSQFFIRSFVTFETFDHLLSLTCLTFTTKPFIRHLLYVVLCNNPANYSIEPKCIERELHNVYNWVTSSFSIICRRHKWAINELRLPRSH